MAPEVGHGQEHIAILVGDLRRTAGAQGDLELVDLLADLVQDASGVGPVEAHLGGLLAHLRGAGQRRQRLGDVGDVALALGRLPPVVAGLLAAALLTVWIHGTLEIAAIVVAGCAGLVIGNSILFPGTYSRGHSFRRGARQGLKIAIGLVPIFVVAGLLEGFVTRYTEMPVWLSLAIIGASLVFAVWYFILYPLCLHARERSHAKR